MARRILLAVSPGLLQGALAEVLSTACGDEVVSVGCFAASVPDGRFDAAVVCTELRHVVIADVVITLPDGRGGKGTGAVADTGGVRSVRIESVDDILELLAAPRQRARN